MSQIVLTETEQAFDLDACLNEVEAVPNKQPHALAICSLLRIALYHKAHANFYRHLYDIGVDDRDHTRKRLAEVEAERDELKTVFQATALSGPFGEALHDIYDYESLPWDEPAPLLPFAHAAVLAYSHARQAERKAADDCDEACCEKLD